MFDVLRQGSVAAQEVAADTLANVKHAMKIDYFEDEKLIQSQSKKFNK